MTDAYLLWKTAHVLGGAVLFGTALGIAYFTWFGYRRALAVAEIDGLRAVLAMTVTADAWITAPAVVFQLASGLVLMQMNSWPLTSPWALASLGLYLLVGLLWLPAVVIQIVLKREAHRVASVGELSAGFHRRFALWLALGAPAFVLVVVIFFLMVAKPLALLTL